MKLVRAFVREEKADELVAALEQVGVTGFTLTKACGRGAKTITTVWRGRELRTMRPMAVLEILVSDNQADDVAKLLIDSARTGRSGDGHVFITTIDTSYAIRTGWIEDL